MMCHLKFKNMSTFLVACFLGAVWQTSSEAQPWKHLQPDPDPQPAGAARDKLKLKIPFEPKSYPSDPIQSDYDIAAMSRKLGNDYNREFTALNKEEVLMKKNNASTAHAEEDDFVRKMLVKSMPDEIKNLDFKMPGMKRHLGSKASKKLQLWL